MKQAEGYARYHIRAGRSATGNVATDSFFYQGQSEKWAMLTQKDAEFEIYDFNTVFWWLKVILPMQRHYQI